MVPQEHSFREEKQNSTSADFSLLIGCCMSGDDELPFVLSQAISIFGIFWYEEI